MLELKEILASTKGKLLESGPSRFTGISTDSRTVKKGEFFVPITGKNFDGNKFIVSALERGAAGALLERHIKTGIKNKSLIRVRDALSAFHSIALAKRRHSHARFVGVTGSSGKTTTKDMLASILSLEGSTLKTEENYNNEIGVPQTLLKLEKRHKFAVIEMAMQGLHEIEALARITLPKISIITNVGKAHMQQLKSEKNIAKAKSEILRFQTSKDSAVLPADDIYFDFLKGRARSKVISFGIDSEADVAAKNIRYGSDSSTFKIEANKMDIQVALPLPGKHNIYDALAAAAAAYALGVGQDKIKKGLENFKLSGKRLNIIRTRHLTVIDDTYNANPDSMAASLNVLENYPPRRIAVLGDMFELGSISIASHKHIGQLAASLNIEVLVTVGKLGRHIAEAARKSGLRSVHTAASARTAVKLVKKLIKPYDTVLIKGSRGMHMEAIVKGLAGKHG